MKQLFRCEYCDETGTEEEIRKHEDVCLWNYNKRTCYTCKHACTSVTKVSCENGVELEAGKYMEGCRKWEHDEKDHTKKLSFGNVFGGFF